MKRILVVVAHSDDEALGCGGTIATEVEKGAEVSVMFLTNGVGARKDGTIDDEVGQRAVAARKACDILGVTNIFQYDFPDNRLDSVPLLDIVKSIEPVIEQLKPTVILTHFSEDLNVDHRVCHQAVLTACRPIPGQPVSTILAFEVASSTEWAFSSSGFMPNFFVNISAQLQKKLKALDAYHHEMRLAPHPRSATNVEALAHWRGGIAGLVAAEAFTVVRMITEEI